MNGCLHLGKGQPVSAFVVTSMFSGPCHHSMVCPWVAYGG